MTRSGTARLPVPIAASPEVGRSAGVVAQVLGQGGAPRGLRGGAPVLRGARAAYLGAQWRGDDDRRPQPGLLTRVSI